MSTPLEKMTVTLRVKRRCKPLDGLLRVILAVLYGRGILSWERTREVYARWLVCSIRFRIGKERAWHRLHLSNLLSAS